MNDIPIFIMANDGAGAGGGGARPQPQRAAGKRSALKPPRASAKGPDSVPTRKRASPEKTGPQQADTRFKPGQSGNPAGRPRGSRNVATRLAEELMADGVQAIVRSVIAKAKKGDLGAARIVLERLVPIRRGRPVEIELPQVTTAADVLRAQDAVIAAVAQGELTPEEGQLVAGMLEAKRRSLETVELDQRLKAIEERLEQEKAARR